jgi:hypothetical protein
MDLPLPDRLQKFAEAQARALGLASAAEYVLSLVAREQRKRADMDQLEASLQQGVASGGMLDVNDQYWDRKRQDLLARHRARDAQASGSSSTTANNPGARP